MQKRIISFVSFDNIHTGENLVEMIFIEFLQFQLNYIIFNLTLNNASDTNAAIKFLHASRPSPLFGVGNFFNIRCMCHIINLVVQSTF